MKISGAERLTAAGPPSYADVVPYARALIAIAPERVLWGTDWPHPNVRQMPDDGDLVDLLAAFAPDETDPQHDPRRQPGAALRLRLTGHLRHAVPCGPTQRLDRRPGHHRVDAERREQRGADASIS